MRKGYKKPPEDPYKKKIRYDIVRERKKPANYKQPVSIRTVQLLTRQQLSEDRKEQMRSAMASMINHLLHKFKRQKEKKLMQARLRKMARKIRYDAKISKLNKKFKKQVRRNKEKRKRLYNEMMEVLRQEQAEKARERLKVLREKLFVQKMTKMHKYSDYVYRSALTEQRKEKELKARLLYSQLVGEENKLDKLKMEQRKLRNQEKEAHEKRLKKILERKRRIQREIVRTKIFERDLKNQNPREIVGLLSPKHLDSAKTLKKLIVKQKKKKASKKKKIVLKKVKKSNLNKDGKKKKELPIEDIPLDDLFDFEEKVPSDGVVDKTKKKLKKEVVKNNGKAYTKKKSLSLKKKSKQRSKSLTMKPLKRGNNQERKKTGQKQSNINQTPFNRRAQRIEGERGGSR